MSYKKKQKNILFKKEKFYFYFCFYFFFKLLKMRFIKNKNYCLTYTVFYWLITLFNIKMLSTLYCNNRNLFISNNK